MRAEERVKSNAGQATAKILVVEDEPNMVAGLRDNFEFEGYQVITARDGVEGDRKSTRLNSSHEIPSRMPSSA